MPSRTLPTLAVVSALATMAPPASALDQHQPSAPSLARAAPGDVLRVWPLDGGVRPGVKGYRVLYRSTGRAGEAVAVTGAVIFPADPAEAKRDIVAWAHPTSGVASKCAPTLLPDLSGTIQGIDRMADLGYVVVATDYVGLGTQDAHPYLIGVPAAHAVLDSVRAARQLHDSGAGNRFSVWGHSQGGHAALFTAIHAASYAPELQLMGVAAAAPATDLVALFSADKESASGRSLTSMAVLSWSRVFSIPMSSLVNAHAQRQFERLANDCIESIEDFIREDQDERALARDFLKVDPVTDPQLRGIMSDNSPGRLPAGTRVFLAQSQADTLVLPRITAHYMKTLCQSGAKVTFHGMQNSSHMTTGRDSAFAAVEWMHGLFKGGVPADHCR